MMVEIKPHELEAMRNLVLNVRALATAVLTENDVNRRKMLQWAQEVEDIVSRIETQ